MPPFSPRSLLKIPFAQRVDHSKKHTRRLSFAVGALRSAPDARRTAED